jgi:putative acetyltransferase
MPVRPYKPADAIHMSALYRRSVEQLGPRHYTGAQVAAWVSCCPSPDRFRALSADGRWTLVAVDDADRPVAFSDLEPDGHIHFLYCAPEAAGTGVTAGLYDALEGIARAQGIGRLYTEASEAARRFFAKHGFTTVVRRDYEIAGVPIHNYAMEKRLDAAAHARE